MMHKDVDRVLYSEEDIKKACERLGEQITKDYQGKKLVLIGTLKGATPFMIDLMRHINLDMEIDFIQISSYEGKKSGTLVFKKDVDIDIKGKDLLFVDDIIDTGKTALMIIDLYTERKANSVEFVALLDKKCNRITGYTPKYVGYDVENEFVIGYGMDFNEKYRNLPYIGVLKEEMYK